MEDMLVHCSAQVPKVEQPDLPPATRCRGEPATTEASEEYLLRAAEHRAAAEREPLENVRQRHLSSAENWERLSRTNRLIASRRERLAELVQQDGGGPAPEGEEARSR